MAVDAQKLYEVTQEGHLILALPLSVLLVSFFLYQTLGPSSLVGVAVLIGFVPIVERVMAGMMKFRTQCVALTDSRVELVASMLRGMRVVRWPYGPRHYIILVTSPTLANASCSSL